jgi:hypothetical protein
MLFLARIRNAGNIVWIANWAIGVTGLFAVPLATARRVVPEILLCIQITVELLAIRFLRQRQRTAQTIAPRSDSAFGQIGQLLTIAPTEIMIPAGRRCIREHET